MDLDEPEDGMPAVWYSGVSEFSAPPQTALAPRSLFKALRITEGSELELRSINLVKGTFAQLKPLDSKWSSLAPLQRESLLEFRLRKHQFLFEGQEISVIHNLQTYRFCVLQTKPNSVISIIDTDLTTDVVPFQSTQEEKKDPEIKLSLGEEQVSEIENAGAEKFFTFIVDDPNQTIQIETRALSGDPDLYVAAEGDVNPSSDHYKSYPSQNAFTWASQDRGGGVVTLSASDPHFRVGRYDMTVHAYGGPTKFAISVKELDAKAKRERGHSFSEMETDDTSGESSTCGNCRKQVPKKALVLHEARCRRVNFLCEKCNPPKLISATKADKEKHLTLFHTPLACPNGCGTSLAQEPLQLHRINECPLRLVNCVYCPLQITHADRGSHQGECGMRQVTCKECAKTFKRKEMFRHLSKIHGKDLSTLSWKDFS